MWTSTKNLTLINLELKCKHEQRKVIHFESLKSHLPKREIALIVGPRQVGKTTLTMTLKEHLESALKKTVFFKP